MSNEMLHRHIFVIIFTAELQSAPATESRWPAISIEPLSPKQRSANTTQAGTFSSSQDTWPARGIDDTSDFRAERAG